MALIQCPSCGRRISDKAERCPGCGKAPIIEDPVTICPECAQQVKTEADSCPNCGYPFSAEGTADEKRGKKKPKIMRIFSTRKAKKPLEGKHGKCILTIAAGCLLAIVLAVVSVSVYNSFCCGWGLHWSISYDGILTISGEGEMRDFDINHKSAIPWYRYADTITGVVIEDGVENIGTSAFIDCCNVKTIRISKSVTDLDYSALWYCSSLQRIEVSADNTEFESVNGVLYTKGGRMLLYYPPAYGQRVFEIPDTVQIILPEAFHSVNPPCTAAPLEHIIMPDSVTGISPGTFQDLTSLKSVELSDSLEIISSYTFVGCTALENIDIPHSVGLIDDAAFSGCTGLSYVVIRNELCSIRDGSIPVTAAIWGHAGSTAGSYAKRNGNEFVNLDEQ